jgi:hypothetical protein
VAGCQLVLTMQTMATLMFIRWVYSIIVAKKHMTAMRKRTEDMSLGPTLPTVERFGIWVSVH